MSPADGGRPRGQRLGKRRRALNLRAGEWVQVRSREEILATLDSHGRSDELPFMPEMLKFCGQRIRVHKSAHKTCDTIAYQGARKLERASHLENARCNGEFHGGCQARCMFFWRDEWLKRVDDADTTAASPPLACSEDTLLAATRVPRGEGAPERYSCQATELNKASAELPWWDFRQYVRDVVSRNIPVSRLFTAFGFWLFEKLLRLGAWRAQIRAYDAVQRMCGGVPYPFKLGSNERTPKETLDLVPGETIEVKSQDEILQTVNRSNRNRGLTFDEEMVEFCGKPYPVLARIQRIINEQTGEMMTFKGDCIILDGVTCNSRFKDKRHFCPRSIYPYWREIWLKRVESRADAGGALAPQSPPRAD